jgi:hypothetical protein
VTPVEASFCKAMAIKIGSKIDTLVEHIDKLRSIQSYYANGAESRVAVVSTKTMKADAK